MTKTPRKSGRKMSLHFGAEKGRPCDRERYRVIASMADSLAGMVRDSIIELKNEDDEFARVTYSVDSHNNAESGLRMMASWLERISELASEASKR